MFRTSFLIVVFSFVSHECAVLSDGTDTGNGGGLREWMRNMKDRMTNREPGRIMGLISSFDVNNMPRMKLPPAVVSMMTGERMFQPVNLANVKFDPSTDRAYRMGNWYVIRRRSTNKDESVDDWAEFFDRKADDNLAMINDGAQRVIDDVDIAKCMLDEPHKSTMIIKESEDDEESTARMLNT